MQSMPMSPASGRRRAQWRCMAGMAAVARAGRVAADPGEAN